MCQCVHRCRCRARLRRRRGCRRRRRPCSTSRWPGARCFRRATGGTLDISAAPVDSRSAPLIDWISGRTPTNTTAVRRLHPDFGPPPYGIPYVVVAGDQPRVPVAFVAYGSQSDAGAPGLPGYPIPDEARTQPNYIEGGVAGGGTSGDRHLLMIDRDRWLLYETFATTWNADGRRAGKRARARCST